MDILNIPLNERTFICLWNKLRLQTNKEDESKRTESKLKQELTEAKIEIHNLKYAQRNLTDENIQLKVSLNVANDDVQSLKSQQNTLLNTFNLKYFSVEQIQNIKQEIDDLKEKHSKAETKAKNELKNLTQIKESIDEENCQMRLQIKNLEMEQNTLFDLLNLPQNDQRNFTSLKKAVENILQNNEFLSKQISEANDKAKLEEEKLQQEIDNLKSRMKEEIQKVSDLNQKLTEKNRQVNDLEQSNGGSGNQSNIQQIEDLNEKVMQTNQKLAIQKEKCQTLENQMQKLMDILNIAPNNRNFYTLRRELEELKQQYSIEKERSDHLATIVV